MTSMALPPELRALAFKAEGRERRSEDRVKVRAEVGGLRSILSLIFHDMGKVFLMFWMFGFSAEVHTCSMEAMGFSLEVRGFSHDVYGFSLELWALAFKAEGRERRSEDRVKVGALAPT